MNRSGPPPSLARRSDARVRRGTLLISAALLVLGAGAIHLAGAPARLGESPLLGIGGVTIGVMQAALAAAVMIVPTRRALRLAGVASAGAALLWGVGHTSGLPAGFTLWRPEPLSIPDLFLPALEVLATLTALATAGRATRPGKLRPWRTGLALLPVLVLTAILAGGGGLGAPDDTWQPVSTPIEQLPDGRTTTVTYCSPNGAPLAMAITEPAATASRPAPAVLYVHGGGPLGDRQTTGVGANLAGQSGALFLPLRDQLVRRGFVVAAIDYRLAPLHPWPAQIEDAKCAVRFMRAEAARLSIDPDRIGAWGSSGGGHLVAMLGTAGLEPGFDVGQYLDQSSRVQAVVDMFGLTDLTREGDASPFYRFIVGVAFAGANVAAASPVTYVAPGDPPFLILHGAEDTGVRPHQSQELARRLDAAGVSEKLVIVQGAGHGLATPGQRPPPDELADVVAAFFGDTLRKRS